MLSFQELDFRCAQKLQCSASGYDEVFIRKLSRIVTMKEVRFKYKSIWFKQTFCFVVQKKRDQEPDAFHVEVFFFFWSC